MHGRPLTDAELADLLKQLTGRPLPDPPLDTLVLDQVASRDLTVIVDTADEVCAAVCGVLDCLTSLRRILDATSAELAVWLHTPHPLLDGDAPIDWLEDRYPQVERAARLDRWIRDRRTGGWAAA